MRFSKIHYSWIILAIGTLIVFGALGLGRFGYTIVLPAMQKSLSMNNAHAGILATSNLAGYLALSVIGGALASRYGPRRVITLGLAISGVGMLLTGTATGFISAVIWRALTGIGSGASNVPAMGLIQSWFGKKRRGFASGIAVSGSSLALIFIGPAVPYILSVYNDKGWRISWFIFGGFTLLLAIIGFFILRNRPSEIGLKPLGLETDETVESHQTKGLHWGHVYRSSVVWYLGVVYFAFGFSYMIYMTFFVKSLIVDGGYTQLSAGHLFMVIGWFSLLCGLIWGTVSDVIGRKRTLFIVYIIHALSFAIFALWSAPVGYTISSILFGLTAWSIPAIMAATCGDVLGSRMAPAALGFITLFFGIGQAIAPSIAGTIADAVGSFSPAFLIASGMALLGAIGTLFLRSSSLQNQSDKS